MLVEILFEIWNEQVARENRPILGKKGRFLKFFLKFEKDRSPVKIANFLFILKAKSVDRWITQKVEQTYFLYNLTMQNLDNILLRNHCKAGICCYLFFWTHKKLKKYIKK